MASWNRKTDPSAYETAELIISGIIPIGLIVIGTLGNAISICILLRKQNRRTSTNIYLMMLCLMDTISLYQWNLTNAVFTLTDGKQQIWGRSLVLCKLSEFFAFYSLHTSAMFLTFVELDRACLLRSSWYKRKIARPRMALALCISILVLLFALNGFLFGLGVDLTYKDPTTGQQQTVLVCYYTLNTGLMDFFANQYSWVRIPQWFQWSVERRSSLNRFIWWWCISFPSPASFSVRFSRWRSFSSGQPSTTNS